MYYRAFTAYATPNIWTQNHLIIIKYHLHGTGCRQRLLAHLQFQLDTDYIHHKNHCLFGCPPPFHLSFLSSDSLLLNLSYTIGCFMFKRFLNLFFLWADTSYIQYWMIFTCMTCHVGFKELSYPKQRIAVLQRKYTI